ncbi:Lysophospholipase L2 [Klebsiella pneumoniae]|uniref:Lysophospholipase L2 n=1 Tax=Klebsiella pneumoniae TaxID=573 RepID=A0A377ZR46_KLEPN|nr:Lysophospholipase L2 [Klebsiella pneumoniae]
MVDNLMHDAIANYGPLPAIPVRAVSRSSLKGAYHEILFEKDAMRSVALNAIVEFFNRHT